MHHHRIFSVNFSQKVINKVGNIYTYIKNSEDLIHTKNTAWSNIHTQNTALNK